MHGQMPQAMPLLSRGKHRNPSKGACFMELASYLAGERWSDHPSCTHPLLAGLARLVNDHTSDAARPRLAELIPAVIGLTGDDLRIDARIALRAATTALPVVAHERQLAMAVSILSAEHVLAELDGRATGNLSDASREVLEQVPDAMRWAFAFRRGVRISAKGFRRYAAPNTVQLAVRGIAQACVQDPNPLLRGLLAQAIDDCRAIVGAPAQTEAAFEAGRWEEACRLTAR
ncbi:hypothetical protein [Planotetraspora kaengkrachanensis]|uniref:Uncharacterized protein n=1 Tax=Planotetraspora kaengkrachanensis TaxID=575193 RepID=A0A8J3PUW2_9ACTN|nr:hypothetical protein [Planotetraspora kaengkrachanensis]GIG81489.1 hypothetical protein Pka01_46160 [Planotetraspora kaengkrachanensis]